MYFGSALAKCCNKPSLRGRRSRQFFFFCFQLFGLAFFFWFSFLALCFFFFFFFFLLVLALFCPLFAPFAPAAVASAVCSCFFGLCFRSCLILFLLRLFRPLLASALCFCWCFCLWARTELFIYVWVDYSRLEIGYPPPLPFLHRLPHTPTPPYSSPFQPALPPPHPSFSCRLLKAKDTGGRGGWGGEAMMTYIYIYIYFQFWWFHGLIWPHGDRWFPFILSDFSDVRNFEP